MIAKISATIIKRLAKKGFKLASHKVSPEVLTKGSYTGKPLTNQFKKRLTRDFNVTPKEFDTLHKFDKMRLEDVINQKYYWKDINKTFKSDYIKRHGKGAWRMRQQEQKIIDTKNQEWDEKRGRLLALIKGLKEGRTPFSKA